MKFGSVVALLSTSGGKRYDTNGVVSRSFSTNTCSNIVFSAVADAVVVVVAVVFAVDDVDIKLSQLTKFVL